LENPYAFVDRDDESAASSRAAIARSRRLLENQWAHLDGSGGFEAIVDPHRHPGRSRIEVGRIEGAVHELHRQLWTQRHHLLPCRTDEIDPIDLLDPSLAFQLVGFRFEYVDGLGDMRVGATSVSVAGRIDTHSRSVAVGMQLPAQTRRFTAAHELGHAMLHPDLGVLHRDVAVDGSAIGADLTEREANRFATLFLMPEKLVRSKFKAIFRADGFDVTEATAFALAGRTVDALARSHGSRRALSRLLASTPRYDGRQVVPLHELFRVSRETMAIRLEELDLV
jgi:hypothetical protein